MISDVQEQYLGDAGDFPKFALLRHLSGYPTSLDLTVGLAWYLVDNQTHLGDGRHVGYLTGSGYAHLRSCDPELFDSLAKLVENGGRTFEFLRALPVLPWEWVQATTFVPVSADRRTAWFAELRQSMARSDIVFLDPDNGLKRRPAPGSADSVKFTWFDEVADLASDGHSLVIYQHRDRSPDQAERIAAGFALALGAPARGWAVVSHMYSQRTFYVLPHPDHLQRLTERIGSFAALDWRNRLHVEVLA